MSVSVEPIRFVFRKQGDDVYKVTLEGMAVGERTAVFLPPYDAVTWAAVRLALAPGFEMGKVPDEVQAALKPLLPVAETVGAALAEALLAEVGLAEGFGVALNLARAERRPLPVEMVFDADGAALAALPWELLRWENRFLVGDSSIALMRYPLASLPRIRAVEALPLRVLLVLAEPVDAPPVFPEGARREILHGLGRLDEQGAVVVDVLRPPTYRTLVEAVRNGEYHMLVFYGHGGHGQERGTVGRPAPAVGEAHGRESSPSEVNGGVLLFEDDLGGQELVTAAALGAALNNSSVRLVLLGACESAVVEEDFQRKGAKGQRGREEKEGKGDRLGLESSLSGLRGGRSNLGALWEGTAQGLLRAGVPLAIGMQLTMRVDAAQAFLRQFMLSLAAGKPVVEALADGRIALNGPAYGQAWCIPALYGRPDGETRLFDPGLPLPAETAALRAEMQTQRETIAALEQRVNGLGSVQYVSEIVQLRQARQAMVQTRAALARQTPGGYAAVASLLFRVPPKRIFVGRLAEVVAVSRGLVGEEPVVIWGTGGIGKTALAIEVAHRQSWRFAGGVLWLDCQGGPALDTLLDGMGAFCGVAMSQVPPEQKGQIVRGALAGVIGRCLLIWDNVEDVWGDGAVRRFVRQLPPNCQALLTTRNEPEEKGWAVQEVGRLPDESMVEMFMVLGSRAQVRGRTADWEIVEQMLGWLEGHPLALELVVPLVRKRGVQRVWRNLQKRSLRGVAAAFAASYERLSEAAQKLFARLSVFGVPFEWKAAVGMMPNRDEDEVEILLDGLVQRKLVNFDGVQWYGFHGLVRQYGYERLKEKEDVQPVHRLAAEYLQGLIKTRMTTPEEELEEVDQWERAAEWKQFEHRAIFLMVGLARKGYWEEIEIRLVKAKKAVTAHLSDEPRLKANLDSVIASMAYKKGRWDEAITLWQTVQQFYETTGDEQGRANTYHHLGNAYVDKGEWDWAIRMYEKSLEILERVGDNHGLAAIFNSLGSVYKLKGEWDQAIQMLEQSLETFERFEDIHGMAQTINNLGSVYHDNGKWDLAIQMYGKSLKILEQLGHIHHAAGVINNLSSIYQKKGEWDRAIRMLEQSLEAYERLGDILGVATTTYNLGCDYQYKKEWDRAIRMLEQSLEAYKRLGDILGVAKTTHSLGTVHRNKGEWDRAIRMFEQSLETYERLGDILGVAEAFNSLGTVYTNKGEQNRAIQLYEKSLEIFERLGDIHNMTKALGNLGTVYADKEEWERAIQLYEKSLNFFEQLEDIHGMTIVLYNLGGVYQNKGGWNKAIQLYEKYLEMCKQLGDIRSMAQAYYKLGFIYLDKEEWDQAIQMYEQSLAIRERVGDSKDMAQVYFSLGTVYSRKEEWDQAIQMFEYSLAIDEQFGNRRSLTSTYMILGNRYEVKGMHNRAIQMYEQFLSIKEQVEDSKDVAQVYYFLGNIYSHKKEWERAIQTYEQSLVIEEQIGGSHNMAFTYTRLGTAYQRKGEWDRAIQMFKNSLAIHEQFGDNRGVSNTCITLAMSYEDNRMHNQAIQMYEQSLRAIIKIGDNDGKARVLSLLSYIYLDQGNVQEAIHCAAQACLIFMQFDTAEAQKMAKLLVDLLGSVEAAKAYLEKMAREQ